LGILRPSIQIPNVFIISYGYIWNSVVLHVKKVLVVFDTTFGNTEKLAREIAAGIEDAGTAECKVKPLESRRQE